ncbi:type VI secretion system tip protein VgrG [Pseudomonas kielensis]
MTRFFDHSRHKLQVEGGEAPLDVLAFEGEEQLSQPFSYRIEFTSSAAEIEAAQMLGQRAQLSLYALASNVPVFSFSAPDVVLPLRALRGVVTAFRRLSGSADEARYELTLQPRLALLARGKQFRIYQHQSVPQIVESILRSRHGFEGQDFFFDLLREYPKREQAMQFGESDLAFISRLLAEVGIWYRVTNDERLGIDVLELHDAQRHYQFDVELPYRPTSGLSSSAQDAVWQLETRHQVVEQHVHFRAYDPRQANAWLKGDVDQSRGASSTYGEAYLYAEPYTQLGDALDQDEELQSESGFFYARLRHERYLNDQTQLSGISSSATLAPGQVLNISGGAPKAFAPGALITHLSLHAARDRSLEVRFQAIPYSDSVCFRPPVPSKPQIAGTVPARVTSNRANDPYGHIDLEGRYKVNLLFDRDSWKPGEESLWLRLARPYAGDTHGLHLPLIAGTEVAIAFEQGDPDRPYIAHALHDSQHPDPVTLHNYKRNVLRTPANNKLRMAELIKAVAAGQTQAGRDPGLHGPLHLFVITNASEDSVGPGAVNTQRMLASLGRAETIPEVTKLQRIEAVKKDATPQPRPEPRDRVGHRELADWQAELDRQIRVVKDSTITPEERPGLKVHLCSLVAPDSPAGNWMPVYIHSKLMIVDDVFTTHGSANINTRSMQVDSELNIAHEWASVTQALRRRLWDLHTDGKGAQDDPGEAFDEWQKIIKKNKELQNEKIMGTPHAPLVEFYYDKATLKDLD